MKSYVFRRTRSGEAALLGPYQQGDFLFLDNRGRVGAHVGSLEEATRFRSSAEAIESITRFMSRASAETAAVVRRPYNYAALNLELVKVTLEITQKVTTKIEPV